MPDQTLTAHGCNIEYRWIGAPTPSEPEAGKPTLVFLHHGLGCVALWRDYPKHLSEATGCPAFLYSREGHGGSDPVEWPRPLDFLKIDGRERLPQVLAAAGIDDFILVGHSEGASISLFYGATVKAGARGIIVMAPHLFVEQSNLDEIKNMQEAYANANLRKGLERYHGANVDSAFHGWAESWLQPGFDKFSIEAEIPDIEVPVLAIRGNNDVYGSNAQTDRLAELATCPVEIVLLDAGHMPHEEATGETLTKMTAFIRGLIE